MNRTTCGGWWNTAVRGMGKASIFAGSGSDDETMVVFRDPKACPSSLSAPYISQQPTTPPATTHKPRATSQPRALDVPSNITTLPNHHCSEGRQCSYQAKQCKRSTCRSLPLSVICFSVESSIKLACVVRRCNRSLS